MFLTNVNRYRTSNVKGVTKKPATDSIERISTVNRQSELPPPPPLDTWSLIWIASEREQFLQREAF